jgi:biofilm PGA synthesis N-glycosyltransferase PgaC
MSADDSQNPRINSARNSGFGPSIGASPTAKYCIITPARDEEQFVLGTIESVLHQTIRPEKWVIVDDGSTDATNSIIAQYALKYSWIQTLRRENRGHRSTGGGVEAFLAGYHVLQSQGWEFLVNLDGDLTFAPDYFERCFEYFRKLPRLGIGGGTIYDKVDGHLRLESSPAFHVRGGTKIYRRECWEKLDGLVPRLGWDTVDELKANQLGWTTQTFPDLRLVQHRVTGSAWGRWGNAVNDGMADYVVGYHPLFFFLKCLKHVFHAPYVLRSLGLAYGFLFSLVRQSPYISDQELRIYLRRQQLRRLMGAPSIWK